ncbi:MAG: N-acetylmuramoyl-L-alanine amidase [Clostridium sp.]
MSKIGLRGGHTKASSGAAYYINELQEDRKIIKLVIEKLKPYNTIIDCQPAESTSFPKELNYGINTANNNNVDVFFSVHFNASAGAVAQALGSEICIHPTANQEIKNKANKILSNLQLLGFNSRGIKCRTDLGELNSTKMSSMIIEVCFVNSKADTDLYNALDKSLIARAIANGIDCRVDFNKKEPEGVEKMKNPASDYNEGYYLYANPDVAKAVANGSFKNGEEHFIKYGYKEGRIYKMQLPSDWSESGYLVNNPDVLKAVNGGNIKSGSYHYINYGWKENRNYKFDVNKYIDQSIKNELIKIIEKIYEKNI